MQYQCNKSDISYQSKSMQLMLSPMIGELNFLTNRKNMSSDRVLHLVCNTVLLMFAALHIALSKQKFNSVMCMARSMARTTNH